MLAISSYTLSYEKNAKNGTRRPVYGFVMVVYEYFSRVLVGGIDWVDTSVDGSNWAQLKKISGNDEVWDHRRSIALPHSHCDGTATDSAK